MSDCPSVIHPSIRAPAGCGGERYRERAARLRDMADDFSAPQWRDILLQLAASYDQLAGAAEAEDT